MSPDDAGGESRDRSAPTGDAMSAGTTSADGDTPDLWRLDNGLSTHLCSLSLGGQPAHPYAADFVKAGLDRGERTLWVRHRLSTERIERLLRARSVDVTSALDDGRLVLRPAQECFYRSGSLDAAAATATLREELNRALEQGFAGLRVVHEMWIPSTHPPDASTVRDFEAAVNLVVAQSPVAMLCLYDVDGPPEEHVLAGVEEHPYAVEGREAIPNLFFSPRLKLPGWSEAERVRRRFALLREYRRGREASRRHATLVGLLRAVRAAADSGEDRERTLERVLKEVCWYTGWPLGHAYTFDRTTGRLEPSMVWYADDPHAHRAFMHATNLVMFEPGQGLPGRVLATGKPAWVSDVDRDPDFDYQAPEARTVHSAFAVPVHVDREVEAVLTFYSDVVHDPDDDLLSVVEHVASVLGEVLALKDAEAELGLSEVRFRTLVRTASDGIVLADADGKIVSWNPAAARLFGYEWEEVRGRPLSVLMAARYRQPDQKLFPPISPSGPGEVPGRHEMHGLTKNSREFPVEISLSTWTIEGEEYHGAIIRDVSHRREAEDELRLLEAAVQNVSEAIVVTTAGGLGKGTILYVNPAFTKMTGYREAEVLGRSFGVVVGPKTDAGTLDRAHARVQRGEFASLEIVAYRRDGSEFLLDWHIAPIREADGAVTHLVSIQRDVTDERLAEEAQRRADRDPLTGLPNREIMVKRVQRALERSVGQPEYRCALLFLDLDGFKRVNDTYGHLVGDQLLTATARRLERTVRPGDTVARFGGDEFVILLEYATGVGDVMTVADRILASLSQPFVVQDAEVSAPTSIGVAMSDSGYESAEEMIEDADSAMYRAKAAGKERYEIADSELFAEVARLHRLRADLSRALERDELRVFYQPLVTLDTGHIFGLEALVRWVHPERGLILPDQFIPLAEDSELIEAIGRWVLSEAAMTVAKLQKQFASDPPLILSVNLSPRELTQAGLVETVQSALAAAGLPAERLQVEITESVFIDRPDDARKQLEALRSLGIQVCIDDFGTGYSSLGYLHRFPVGFLKIDRLFMHAAISGEPGNREIIRTIVALAQNLGLDVLAEGVETADQLQLLKELSCPYGQGFLFSKPLDTEDLIAVLTQQAPGAEGDLRWN